MYYSLNTGNCQQKFTRLIEQEDDLEIPNLSEEISYLFASSDASKVDKSHMKRLNCIQLQTKKFYFCQFDDESSILYSIARKQIRQAEDALLSDNSAPNIAQIHSYITDLLKLHRYLLLFRTSLVKNVENTNFEYFQCFKSSMLKFTDLPVNALQKLIATLVRHSDNVISQYFHLHLDILWLSVTMSLKTPSNKENIIELMQELHFVSYKCWEKANKYVIICKCMKVVWLRVQLYCEKCVLNFWELFNTSIECYNEEFVLLALKFVAELQTYSAEGVQKGTSCPRVQENLEFFNQKWSLLVKNANSECILRVLQSVDFLLGELWLEQGGGNFEFFRVTWDYYYKRIEEVEEKRPFVQLIDEINAANMGGESGFLRFLAILRRHLERHPNHWKKLKARIYTKFPISKFCKLSDQGLKNLSLVFFALTPVNFDEVSDKLLGLIKELPRQRQNSLEVWNVYIYMIKSFLDNARPINTILEVFLPNLEEAAQNRGNFNLLALFSSNLSSFFRVGDLTLKQSQLIGHWLENYLKSCAHNELLSLLNSLLMIIERTVDSGVWYEYQANFIVHVLNAVKKLNVNQALIGTVAGLIVANSEGLDNVVEEFLSENVSGDVMMSFFMTLKRKSLYTTNERRELLTLKAWFLSWIVGSQNVAFTQEVQELIKSNTCTSTNISTMGADPFEEFLKTTEKDSLLKCLSGSDKYFAKHLNLRVYVNIALVLNTCGPFVYNRNASSCFLCTFVDQFLLPVEVLRGNRASFFPHVEKTWHFFIHALWQLDTDTNGDPYLKRVLKDLTVRYLPHFTSKPSPLIKILPNKTGASSLCQFIFEKISLEFFEYNKAKFVSDEHLFRVLNSVNSLLDNGDATDNHLHCLFGRCFLLPLFEVYMFKNHKVIAVEMIKKIALKRSVNEEVKQIVHESLLSVTKKHLAFGTNQYFQMCYVLVKFFGDVFKVILPKIWEDIKVLECKRGQGFDNHLRQSYDKLSKLCNN